MNKKIFFIALLLIFMVAGCNPYGVKKWVVYTKRRARVDPNNPLTVLKDGYRATRVYEFQGKKVVDWAWMITVRNEFDDDIIFDAEYILQAKGPVNLVADSSLGLTIKPKETKTIHKNAAWNLPFDKFKSVAGGNWKINQRNLLPWETD